MKTYFLEREGKINTLISTLSPTREKREERKKRRRRRNWESKRDLPAVPRRNWKTRGEKKKEKSIPITPISRKRGEKPPSFLRITIRQFHGGKRASQKRGTPSGGPCYWPRIPAERKRVRPT